MNPKRPGRVCGSNISRRHALAPTKDKQTGVSKQVCYLGEAREERGGHQGVIGSMQVGFEVLGVAYGCLCRICERRITLTIASIRYFFVTPAHPSTPIHPTGTWSVPGASKE